MSPIFLHPAGTGTDDDDDLVVPTTEIQTRLTQRTTAVLRNARNNNHPSTPNGASQGGTSLNPLSTKDHQAYAKITAEWNKIDLLQSEKTTLATRLVSIVTRHKERGREEYKKIVGDEVVDGLVKAEREVDLSNPTGLAQMVNQYTGGAGMIVAGPSSSSAAGGAPGSGLASQGNSQRGSVGPGTISVVTASDERTTKSESRIVLPSPNRPLSSETGGRCADFMTVASHRTEIHPHVRQRHPIIPRHASTRLARFTPPRLARSFGHQSLAGPPFRRTVLPSTHPPLCAQYGPRSEEPTPQPDARDRGRHGCRGRGRGRCG